jgi:thioredoxin reductase
MTPITDPRSTVSSRLEVGETADLLVVGGGPAGLAAAIEAARSGISVILADENPVPAEVMGDDVPLHFGQRMGGAVRNRSGMTEAMLASEPLLETALEAGVDVRLSTFVWGLYANGRSVSWLPGMVAGLSDGAASWMLGCKTTVVAAGRRDMGLAFPGWERPGVMGATAAERLATRYGALDARRAVILGTGAEALLAALAMHRAGIAITAIVEQADAPIGPAPLLKQIHKSGIEILTRHVIAGAEGGAEGVTAARLAPLDDAGRRQDEKRIECDTIVLGIGAVPVIELLDAAGCRSAWFPGRGGHVPIVNAAQMTSVPGIYSAGDCAGVWAEKSGDRAIAEAEGRRAAQAAVKAARGQTASDPVLPENAAEPSTLEPLAAEPSAGMPPAYRLDWVRAAVVEAVLPPGQAEPHVCQCEEVTARDILEVRPPRYLQWDRPRRNSMDLTALLGEGAPSPDQVKRLTRAGMGLCQGRRCREQVAALLALGAGTALSEVPLATFRAPVRPMPLSLAGSVPESEEMARNWHVWFGIEGQVTPYWEIDVGEGAA